MPSTGVPVRKCGSFNGKGQCDRVLKMEVEQDVEKEKDHGQR